MKNTSKATKIGLVLLIVLNSAVLLGQIWPDGAPPFAKTVNIIFLTLSLIYFIWSVTKQKRAK